MSEHTPVPWQAFPLKNPTMIKTVIGYPGMDDSELRPVIALGEGVNKVANAEHIVRACNSYDETLEALREALGVFQLLGSGQKPPFSCAEMCDRIGAAIAKAEGRE